MWLVRIGEEMLVRHALNPSYASRASAALLQAFQTQSYSDRPCPWQYCHSKAATRDRLREAVGTNGLAAGGYA